MDNIPTEPGQSFANVKWQLPVYADNSNEPLTLNGSRPPQKINVGKKYIRYKVTDTSGLSGSCEFFFHVKGTHCIHLKWVQPYKFKHCLDVWKISWSQYGVTVVRRHSSRIVRFLKQAPNLRIMYIPILVLVNSWYSQAQFSNFRIGDILVISRELIHLFPYVFTLIMHVWLELLFSLSPFFFI